ncbi:N-acetyltransferase [Elizabethkingia meningoseptica]|uniref:N-acetyltransferase n=1 Tax=Elizabethkingia meningoseptica TaxID=238 RepID=UPI000A8A820F|nr:N-acetyltransferase [Elizabethkingia meningoseptica]SQG05718.1 Uncharacterized N-acetyltransferase YjaB [Elizabethkingia meningoseptica]
MLIRKASTTDFDRLTEIWLEASVQAHHFVEPEYWQEKAEDMKNSYLPSSETFVFEDGDGVLLGFVSLVEEHIAAFFIDTEVQRKGVGSQLLLCLQQHYDNLTLNVYSRNTGAIQFYKKYNFTEIEEKREGDTGELEYLMAWKRRQEREK